MRKTIIGFSLGAVLFGTWAAHGAPSASMMYQLSLAKMNSLMGTTSINATTGITTNNVSLGDLTYTQAGAANSSLSHIWSDGSAGTLTTEVPTGKVILGVVNGTAQFNLGRAFGSVGQKNWSIGGYASQVGTYATSPGIASLSGAILYNAIAGQNHSFLVDGNSMAAINATAFALNNGDLQFHGTGAANSSLSHIWSDGSAGNLTLGVPAGRNTAITCNGTSMLSTNGVANFSLGHISDNTYASVACTDGGYTPIVNGYSLCASFRRRGASQLDVGLGGLTWFANGLGTTVNSTISLLSDAANTLTANVPATGTLRACVNGTTVASANATSLSYWGGGAAHVDIGKANISWVSASATALPENAQSIGSGLSTDGPYLNSPAPGYKIKFYFWGKTGATLAIDAGTNTTLETTPQIALANSSTYPIMATAGHYGILDIVDNAGNYAKVRLTPTACILAADSTANYVISSSPSAAQIGLNVTSGNLTIVTGSSAACNITSIYRGI